eukprot:gb/GFBE01081186.1/.p1 GENE.gb/GFBE01081186.1/~~gb/GFBE01081186.1/.p1  ORF type:complete len:202 (+),score=28.06 gb/GFBE01081186.1/:1-606(+)
MPQRTAFSDPGLIPKASADGTWQGCGFAKDCAPEPRRLCLNNVWIRQDFCTTCHAWRPPRSKHFGLSGFCVRRFDHFCRALGTVVGQGNYRSFLALLHCVILLNTCAVLLLLLRVWPARGSYWKTVLWDSPDLLLALGYALLWLLFAVPVAALHWWLVFNNLTTNEYVRNYYGPRGSKGLQNPFDKGCVMNIHELCCAVGE